MRFIGIGHKKRVEEFKVVTEYKDGANVFRAISMSGSYLSEAEGDTIEDLMYEVSGLEEVWDLVIIPENGDEKYLVLE